MDPVWRSLPSDLVSKIICKVKVVDEKFKTDVKFGVLDHLTKRLDRMFDQDSTNEWILVTLLCITDLRDLVVETDDIQSVIEVLWAGTNQDQVDSFTDAVDLRLSLSF